MTPKHPSWLPPALHGRLALRPQEAADALGIHRDTLEHEIQSGRLPSKKLGHATVEMTMDIYARTTPAQRRAAAETMGRVVTP